MDRPDQSASEPWVQPKRSQRYSLYSRPGVFRARKCARERRAQQADAAAGVEHAPHRQPDVIRVRGDEVGARLHLGARHHRRARVEIEAAVVLLVELVVHARDLASSRRIERRTSKPPARPVQADQRRDAGA